MFIDRTRIRVTSGAGGNGCIAFRREKYVPFGGPSGGDGGGGGDIVLLATTRVNSLNHIRFHSIWRGKRGEHGLGSDMAGKRAEDVVIEVPIGTVALKADTQDVVADLSVEGMRVVVAKGGAGGKGNARFTSSTHQAPRFAEKGEPGEEVELILELKLIADVGIAGLPNAGKSTLLATISAARPKIADYPFTTLSPNLGVVDLSDYRTFTAADIPGIIEGAAQGKGLGLEFLRHIERTKVILILVDPSFEDPKKTLKTLENELSEYSEAFADRPRLIVFSKADLPEVREKYAKRGKVFKDALLISAATGEGIPELLEALWQAIERAKAGEPEPVEEESFREYEHTPAFKVERAEDGFRVEGKKIVRAVRMTDFGNDEAVRHLDRMLKKMGVYKALKRMGAAEGSTIHIEEAELEYHAE
jgi:GTP-binding protein